MSGLALTYASTGNQAAADKGAYLVNQLARYQARDRSAGFHDGYLSAFPETFFDRLEAGLPVWSPYYMIHKIMAGLIDQHELTGNGQALEVAARLGDWVGWRTGRLSYAHMQRILETEHGGLAESLANLYRLTWDESYLRTAERFYHARVFDPLARGQDDLDGLHANTNIPKMIACIRIWEETGDLRYHDIGANFWRIVTGHHAYVIGGTSNYEHWHAPDVIAGQLSNRTCENCCSYNMLKLTRLLHFHQPHRVDLLDYYERTLFNQMLGEQDPQSAHGFNIYYTGLSPAAFKRQPPFMGTNPDVYSTNYRNFSCDDATGMETQAKFADTIYSRDSRGLFVNLFIPSEVCWDAAGVTIRQATGFPDEAGTHLTVLSGSARMTLRIRLPGWLAGRPARLGERQAAGRPAHAGYLAGHRPAVAARRPGGRDPAHDAGPGPHPGPARGAGRHLRPGGAQRWLRRGRIHADAPDQPGVRHPASRAAAAVPGRRGRPGRLADPGRPGAPPALQRLLADLRGRSLPRRARRGRTRGWVCPPANPVGRVTA